MKKDEILKALNWRYATKQFDPTKKLAQEDLETLLEVAHLAPSSSGSQPWKFIVVTDQAMKEKLKPAAYNQAQVGDSSALLVFCRRTDINETLMDKVVDATAQARHKTTEDLKGYKDLLMNTINSKPTPEVLAAWAARQVYIPLGMVLEAAALMGIDACPMEGFNPQQFDEILGLKEKNATSLALCALGYRSASDPHAAEAKARLSKEEILVRI